jgi:hypothetical protein
MVFVLSAMSPGPRACTTHASDANVTFGAAPGNLHGSSGHGLAVARVSEAEVDTILFNGYHHHLITAVWNMQNPLKQILRAARESVVRRFEILERVRYRNDAHAADRKQYGLTQRTCE